ncbi:BON domain-containing protein [Paraflavisolibacter sp. H34]|uniref:BON domain-containing protein n=1 Tax=Huijunlia imazamoxiresistens TaxID=3127457 RepID=UPI00301B016B
MADNNRNRGSFYASDENWDRDESNYRRESQYEERRNINYDRDEDYGNRQGDQGYGGKWGRSGHSGGQQGHWQQDYNYGRGQGQAGDEYRTGYGASAQGEGRWQGNERRNPDYRGGYGGQGSYGRRHEDYSLGEQGDYGSGYGASGSYGSAYGTSNYRYGTGRGRQDQDYGRTSGGQGYGERGRDWRSSGQYEGERRRGDHDRDRDWWDKTRDEVSSWFGDEDAERRRDADHIREGAHKGKGPRNYKRSDDRIREDVCDRLSDDAYVDASDIDVRVSGNEVILTGTVESREDKRRAEELAERISGVSNVQNQLRVGHVQTTVGSSEIRTDDSSAGRTGKRE